MRGYSLESTFDVKFTTRKFSTGVPFTLAGSPVVVAYPGNSTTEITAGITLTVDFDARTGLNNVRIVATAANGYATDTNYTLVITVGTVDGVSVVGEVAGEFSLGAQTIKWNPDWDAEVESELDDSLGGGTGTALTAIPWNAAWDAEVQSEVADALAVFGPPTVAQMDARTLVAADYATAAALNIVDDFMDTEVASILTAVDTEVAAIKAVTDVIPNAGALTTLSGLATAIKAVTDILPNAGALTSLATQASVNAINDFVDTEVAAIKAKTDNLPASPANESTVAAIKVVTDVLSALTAVVVNALQHGVRGNVVGVVGTGSTVSSVVTSSLDPAAAVADQFKGRVLTFLRDTTTVNLRGQATTVNANTSAGVFTVTPILTTAPVSGDVFVIT